MHEGIGAWEQLARRIVYVHLDVQGARNGINRVTIPYEDSGKGLARKGVEGHFDLVSRLRRVCIDLRNRNIDSQLLDGGQVEELFGRRVVPGLDQRSDVGIAGRDDSVEGGGYVFESLQLLESIDVGLIGIDQCTLRMKIA